MSEDQKTEYISMISDLQREASHALIALEMEFGPVEKDIQFPAVKKAVTALTNIQSKVNTMYWDWLIDVMPNEGQPHYIEFQRNSDRVTFRLTVERMPTEEVNITGQMRPIARRFKFW